MPHIMNPTRTVKMATPAQSRVLVQHLGAVAASFSGILVGLGLGWSSAAMSLRQGGGKGFDITLEEWSWVTSLFGLGAAIGSVAVGKLVHSLGRKAVILAAGPVTAVAFALHIWASSIWMLYLGRLLVGVTSGAACVATPIYVCEMSQPDIRGALSTYLEALLCIGILVVYILGKFLSVYWVNVVCLALCVVHTLGFACFPDTPRWHLLHGREKQARYSMRFYRGPEYDVDAEVLLVKQGIKESAMEESVWVAFSTTAAKKALIITTVLMVLLQITGVNAITFYASQLFTEAGTFDAYTASIVVAIVDTTAVFVSMGLVDRAGRRLLLLISAASMGVCTSIMGGYFFFKEHEGTDMSSLSWLPIVVVSIYMFAFSIGFGPVIWVLLGELFPDNVKGVATGVASSTGWVMSFLITKFYPGLADSLGNYVCYWIFFGLCVISCIFIIFSVPETKGKTLDQIQAELSGRAKTEAARKGALEDGGKAAANGHSYL